MVYIPTFRKTTRVNLGEIYHTLILMDNIKFSISISLPPTSSFPMLKNLSSVDSQVELKLPNKGEPIQVTTWRRAGAWRIIPVRMWLGSPPFISHERPFGRATTRSLGDLLTMVMNH